MANVIKVPTRTNFGTTRPTLKIFAQSGYYAPPRDCVVKIHLIGAGGGGANGGWGPSYYGAGGGYVVKTLRVKGGVAYNVTIGAGGSGGSQTTNQPFSPFDSLHGSAGGNTSFTNWDIEPLIAYGGAGSNNVTTPGPTNTPNAIGGWGQGGDTILQGGHGYARGVSAISGKFHFDIISLAPSSAVYDPLDIAAQDPFSSNFNIASQPTQYSGGGRGGFGGGGSGGAPTATAPFQPAYQQKFSGGPGGQGLVIIEEL